MNNCGCYSHEHGKHTFEEDGYIKMCDGKPRT